jgi:hypothetical protein
MLAIPGADTVSKVTIFRLRGFRIAAHSLITVSVLFLIAQILQKSVQCYEPTYLNRY